MFCAKCGTKFNDDAQFCVKCGTKSDTSGEKNNFNQNSNTVLPPDEAEEKESILDKLIGNAITIVIVFVGAFFINNVIFGGGGNRYIDMVRDGHFGGFPNVTVGRAFGNFYDNVNWSHFENAQGENIVRFSGRLDSSTYEWDFHVGRETFDVVAIRVNGVDYGLIWVNSWIATIFMFQ